MDAQGKNQTTGFQFLAILECKDVEAVALVKPHCT
jgi:hypothetical protein